MMDELRDIYDAIVVGGGPAGLNGALMLGRRDGRFCWSTSEPHATSGPKGPRSAGPRWNPDRANAPLVAEGPRYPRDPRNGIGEAEERQHRMTARPGAERAPSSLRPSLHGCCSLLSDAH